jgi:hypothetical protein
MRLAVDILDPSTAGVSAKNEPHLFLERGSSKQAWRSSSADYKYKIALLALPAFNVINFMNYEKFSTAYPPPSCVDLNFTVGSRD